MFDTEDLSKVLKYTWYMNKVGYFRASLGSREKGHILLHRLIMDAKEGEIVDHINGDKSDNRKSNLRICTNAENVRNAGLKRNSKSGLKGVYFDKRRNKWCSRIYRGRNYHLGQFDTPEEAAMAYDNAAVILHGDFARTNEMISKKKKGECEHEQNLLELDT